MSLIYPNVLIFSVELFKGDKIVFYQKKKKDKEKQ